MSSEYFVFREARSTKELEALLRLRYQVYKECRTKVMFPENPHGLDLDAYDLRSRHFGLFLNGSEPIGYMRVVEDRVSPAHDLLLRIASRYSDLLNALQTRPEHPFPLTTYSTVTNKAAQPLLQRHAAGERLVEPGRFALHPDYQSRKLGRHMIESAIATYFFAFQVENAMLTCHKLHRAIYRQYGFRSVPTGEQFDVYGLQVCILFATPKDVPARVRPRIESMAADFQKTGEICYPAHSPVSASTIAIRTPQHLALRVAA